MKSSNNKGVALVLLVITITIIGIMGAGIISFVSSKHKTYPFQAQSYQAYTLAQAGVEFATRYAHDNWLAFSSSLPASATPYIPSQIPVNCTTSTGKAVRDSANNILFYLCYDYTSDQLTSIGVSGVAQRKIVLRNFRTYYANH